MKHILLIGLLKIRSAQPINICYIFRALYAHSSKSTLAYGLMSLDLHFKAQVQGAMAHAVLHGMVSMWCTQWWCSHYWRHFSVHMNTQDSTLTYAFTTSATVHAAHRIVRMHVMWMLTNDEACVKAGRWIMVTCTWIGLTRHSVRIVETLRCHFGGQAAHVARLLF